MAKKFLSWILVSAWSGTEAVHAQSEHFAAESLFSVFTAVLISAILSFILLRSEKVRAINAKYNLVCMLTEFFESIPNHLENYKQSRLHKLYERLNIRKSKLIENYNLEKKTSKELERKSLIAIDEAKKDATNKEKLEKEREKKQLEEQKRAEELRKKLEAKSKENMKSTADRWKNFKKEFWDVLYGLELAKTPAQKEEIRKSKEEKNRHRINEDLRQEKLKLLKIEEEKKQKIELAKKQNSDNKIKERKTSQGGSEFKFLGFLGRTKTAQQTAGKNDAQYLKWSSGEKNEDIIARAKITVDIGKKLSAQNGRFKLSEITAYIMDNYKIDRRLTKQIEFEAKTHIIESQEFQSFSEYGSVYFRTKK